MTNIKRKNIEIAGDHKVMEVTVNKVGTFSITDFETVQKESLLLIKFSPTEINDPRAMTFAFTPTDGEKLIASIQKALAGRIERKGH